MPKYGSDKKAATGSWPTKFNYAHREGVKQKRGK